MEDALKYKDRLLQSDQEKDQMDVEYQVEQAKLQLDADLLATKRSLAESEKALVTLKSSFPLNAASIVDQQGDVAELKAGMSALEALKKELF